MFMSMVAEQGMFIGVGKGLFSVGRLSFSENSGRLEIGIHGKGNI